MKSLRIASLAVVAMIASTPAIAYQLPAEPGAARTVGMYDAFCLNSMPDISVTERAAKAGEFTEVKGKALDKYQPQVPADELKAWQYEDFGANFVLITSKARPDDQFKRDVPEFANSDTFSCSLMIPAGHGKQDVLKGMHEVIGRAADESYMQGAFRVHAWTGQTDSLLIIAYYYEPTRSGMQGILSTATFVKK